MMADRHKASEAGADDTRLLLSRAINGGRIRFDIVTLDHMNYTARNSMYEKSTSWRICKLVLNLCTMCSAMVKSASGVAAHDMARGVVGAGTGSTLVETAMRQTNLVLPKQ